jgi:hypothetical protein
MHTSTIRRTIATTVAILALSSTGVAHAATDATGDADDTTTTTVAKARGTKGADFRAAMAAWQAEMRIHVAKRAEILGDFRAAAATALADAKTALAAATTKDARKAAQDAFKSAMSAAKTARDAAIDELGDRPVKPTR